MRRTGKPICGLTLSNTAAGEEFAVRVQPPLRSGRRAVRAGDLADGSRRDRAARGATARSWRFEEAEGAKWQRSPGDRQADR